MPRRRKTKKSKGLPPNPIPSTDAVKKGWDREAEEALRESIIWATRQHAAQSPTRIGVNGEITSGRKKTNKKEWKKLMAKLSLEGINWKQVAHRMECHTCYTGEQCKKYWTEELHKKRVKGAWSTPEDDLLCALIDVLGPAYWSRLSDLIPGRTGKQCRERWLNHLDPTLKKGPWSEAEIQCLIDNQKRYNNGWSKIARLIPGRSENAVKNQWNSIMHRTYAQELQQSKAKGRGGEEAGGKDSLFSTLKLKIPANTKVNGSVGTSPIRPKPTPAFGEDLRRPKSASPSKASNRVVMVPRLLKEDNENLDRMFSSLSQTLSSISKRHEVNMWQREPSGDDATTAKPDPSAAEKTANATSRARYRPASTPRTDSKKRFRRAGTTPKHMRMPRRPGTKHTGIQRSVLGLKNDPVAFSYRADDEGRALEITNTFVDKELRRARLFERMKIDVSKHDNPRRSLMPPASPLTSPNVAEKEEEEEKEDAAETAKTRDYFRSAYNKMLKVSKARSPSPWFRDSRYYFDPAVDQVAGLTTSPKPWFRDRRFSDATPRGRRDSTSKLEQDMDIIGFTHGAALPDGGGDEEPVAAHDDDNWFQELLLSVPSPKPRDYSLAMADLNVSFDVAEDFMGEEQMDGDEAMHSSAADPASSSDVSERPASRLRAASSAVEVSALTPTARALYHINTCFDNGNISQDEKFKRKADLVGRQRSASGSRLRVDSPSDFFAMPSNNLRMDSDGDDDALGHSLDDLPSH